MAGEKNLVIKGIDRDRSAYNSPWPGRLTDNKVILVATHGGVKSTKTWVDIWEVQNIGGSNVTLKKMDKAWVALKGPKNCLIESMDILPLNRYSINAIHMKT